MNRLRAFIKKEFKHLLRDYRTVLIIFGIPLVQLLLFGHVISTEIKNARIALIDAAVGVQALADLGAVFDDRQQSPPENPVQFVVFEYVEPQSPSC